MGMCKNISESKKGIENSVKSFLPNNIEIITKATGYLIILCRIMSNNTHYPPFTVPKFGFNRLPYFLSAGWSVLKTPYKTMPRCKKDLKLKL